MVWYGSECVPQCHRQYIIYQFKNKTNLDYHFYTVSLFITNRNNQKANMSSNKSQHFPFFLSRFSPLSTSEESSLLNYQEKLFICDRLIFQQYSLLIANKEYLYLFLHKIEAGCTHCNRWHERTISMMPAAATKKQGGFAAILKLLKFEYDLFPVQSLTIRLWSCKQLIKSLIRPLPQTQNHDLNILVTQTFYIPLILQYLIRMRFKDKDCQAKRKYSRISFKKREKLIQDVEYNGLSLSYIAKQLKIKQSTARMIVRKYKESGQFRTKNFRNKRNTDLREWGATKNAGKIQKIEQFDQNSPEILQQNHSEPNLTSVQPKIEEQQWQGNFGSSLYWFYYMPAFDYMLFS